MRRLVVVLVLLAACSSGGGDGEAGTTTTTAPTTTTTTAPAYESEVYADPAHWLCRGDVDDDPCDVDMDATVVEADGTTAVERFEPIDPDDAEVDCFYVYPTISRDPGASSDLVPQEEQEVLVVRNQAARLGEACRVFAPVYRQTTLTALVARISGAAPPPGGEDSREVAYADVVDAWKHYLANDNGGRGVVLVGHSQGAGLLNRLVQEEIDGDEDAGARLVSALLLGSTVGPDDFTNVPPCEAADQVGCVVTYASFRSTAPPPDNSFFGRGALCTNPAALGGGSGELHPYFTAEQRSILGGEATAVEWATGVTVDTPFVTLPGLVRAECVEEGGFSYLSLTVQGDPATPRIDDIGGDLTPEWGMHLVDVNVAMGDLVELVRSQAEAYAAT